MELVYIINGEGTRFIGDNIDRFESGYLVLLNSNLPHIWKSVEEYFKPKSKKMVAAIVIQLSTIKGQKNLSGIFFAENNLLNKSGAVSG